MDRYPHQRLYRRETRGRVELAAPQRVGAVPKRSYELVTLVYQLLLGHRGRSARYSSGLNVPSVTAEGLGRGRCEVFAR